ncbi:TcpQ domain-containing protein [Alcaligenaceae bacterium]|nr:TcpQ domain-containing protein [Alcaligenaceae bacterium]
MVRLLFITVVVGLLSACAHLPDWVKNPLLGEPPGPSSLTAASQYRFDWRLSGDRQVAPLQVFDNGKQTWLQFQPDQAIPAIFQHTPQGDTPLTYQRQGPYVVLPGVWSQLVLRGGQLQSRVERIQPEAKDDMPDSTQSLEPIEAIEVVDSQVIALTEPSFEFAALAESALLPLSGPVDIEHPSTHTVSPSDKNLRKVLGRWAVAAGWTFEPEHWVVDADIPIVGSASFQSGFKQAVQELVATTELADRPLQPCFYSNRVLRIVPYAQTCDRSAGVRVS